MSEGHQDRALERTRWWDSDPTECFWLEATDRDDIGADLKAPETDDSGAGNWRYTLFKETRPGDIVLHYNKRAGGIVGYSTVAGPWTPAPIIWAARGSYAHHGYALYFFTRRALKLLEG